MQSNNDKDDSIDRLITNLRFNKVKVQPRIVIVGPLDGIESSYVLASENLRFTCTSPRHALYIALTSCFALDVHYPSECKNAWLFVEKAVFLKDLDDMRTCRSSSVVELISDVNSGIKEIEKSQTQTVSS